MGHSVSGGRPAGIPWRTVETAMQPRLTVSGSRTVHRSSGIRLFGAWLLALALPATALPLFTETQRSTTDTEAAEIEFDNFNLPKHLSNDDEFKRELESKPNPLGPPPVTGRVRSYNFTVTRELRAPDGVDKQMLLVNGQFPGPLIEANWGDIIEVHVHNALDNPKVGTSFHWHGFPQTQTGWFDGVPGIHQCPIAPGQSFTYRFRAEVYGTTWYHAHYSAQYMDGLYGPIVIHGPQYAKYDIDVGPILLADHIHVDYHNYIMPIYNTPIPFYPPVKNNLINGKNPYDCALPLNGSQCTNQGPKRANFRFETGKTHLLRLINAGGSGNQKFSIDNHELIVISNDFTPIKPYKTKLVTLGAGQRTDVLVVAKGKSTDAVWLRAELDVRCLDVPTFQPNATAPIYYNKADTSRLPKTKGFAWKWDGCINEPLSKTVPLYSKRPPKPDITLNADITLGVNGTGHVIFFVNNQTLYAKYGEPILRDVYYGKTDFSDKPNLNVVNTGKAKSVRLVVTTNFRIQHSMHLHGVSDFWVLAEGNGKWDGRITNPSNPIRRDVQQMLLGTPEEPSYMVLQWESTNPGVWPFHCHLLLHSSAGLIMNFLQQPERINNPAIPQMMAKTCDAWDKFAAENQVDQPDSGLRMMEME
ncbi:LOW QUALITY PROTEIN: extracellular dihydrogeodin oxidase/laccase-like protein [Paramyrothecium foliicola]|nr:LOW QUALITY PROTEIN: extracellular dihydrogeodin oxidase/laccase-like protein [Paramyrothecium foliicola]